MDRLSDTQIRAGLRNVLARHRMDLSKTNFVCARGVVRLMGELKHQGAHGHQGVEPSQIEAMEEDLHRLRGIKRIYFDLTNWLHFGRGQWKKVEERAERLDLRGD